MNQRTQTKAPPLKTAEKSAVGQSLVAVFAGRYGIEPGKMLETLRSTAFNTGKDKSGKANPPATNEEMAALLAVANEYNLNPFTKEIYAFRNQGGGITPIVGYDGWIRLVQRQPMFDGEELTDGYDERPDKEEKPRGYFYTCKMYRKDRRVPTIVTEYHNENWRNTEPWNSMPNRMTRMRAYIQCARMAFGFGGIYEPDEGERIALGENIDLLPLTPKPPIEPPRAKGTTVEGTLTDDLREKIEEALAKTGVPDNALLAKFEVGTLDELRFDQAADALRWIEDNAP